MTQKKSNDALAGIIIGNYIRVYTKLKRRNNENRT